MPSAAPAKSARPEWCYPANLLTELRLASIPALLVALAFRRFGWALVIFAIAGVSDGCDGWLARHFNQRSVLGAYLDPIADKLLLTSLFLILALDGQLPWALTILVLVRDGCILTSAGVLYAATSFRDFRPTWWGKASTTAELATVGFALLQAHSPAVWIFDVERVGWVAVTALSVISGVHYAFASARRYHLRPGASVSGTRGPSK